MHAIRVYKNLDLFVGYLFIKISANFFAMTLETFNYNFYSSRNEISLILCCRELICVEIIKRGTLVGWISYFTAPLSRKRLPELSHRSLETKLHYLLLDFSIENSEADDYRSLSLRYPSPFSKNHIYLYRHFLSIIQ